MTFDTIVFIIIVLVVGAVSIVRKLKEVMEAQAESREDTRVEYEATPAEIQDFLRSITTGRAREADVQAPPAPRPAPVGQQKARLPEAAAGRSFWDALEAPVRTVPAAAPQQPRTRPKRRAKPQRRQAAPAPESSAPKPREVPVREKGKAAAGVTPLALRGVDLKQAFAWSEILAPPVALRGRRGNR